MSECDGVAPIKLDHQVTDGEITRSYIHIMNSPPCDGMDHGFHNDVVVSVALR